jgi:hypothetical protein
LNILQLSSKPIPQIAWYLQNKEELSKLRRHIDKMTTLEISRMYECGKFFCDTCGRELDNKHTLQEHILHMINPKIIWNCEDCFQSDLRKDRPSYLS